MENLIFFIEFFFGVCLTSRVMRTNILILKLGNMFVNYL